MLFHAKIGIWGKNLYVSHTLFILYLEGNHTLFGEKLYFIWNLAVATLHLPLSTFYFQVTEWWLVFVLAEVVSHDVTHTQQRSRDHLMSTARQILSVCPSSVECATSGKQHIVMEIVPPLMLRLLPVAASRSDID